MIANEIDWYNRAVGLLARREHSVFELRQKLRQKGALSAEIDDVLQRLVERNYQSDERFALSYVRTRVAAGFGPIRIRVELVARGVAPELIDTALSRSDVFWQQQLSALWQRRFHGKLPKNQQEYGRQVRFLVQRGFPTALVLRLICIS